MDGAHTLAKGSSERLGLGAITDIAILKAHWKRMRPQVRAPRVQTFYLAADPLEWLPFEYRLDQELLALADAVSKGEFRAARPEVIRSAKSLGLTRPLAFLSPPDTLLYRSIVSRAEVNLLQVMPDWSRFGRADAKQAVDDREPESGWFRAWLARTGQLWAITENYDWLVETDISNFFPSVHLDAALDHLLAHTRLGVDVVRLLSHMLKEFAPLPEYRVSPVGGLPQESFDCSRIIAHSFLQPVDQQFEPEGRAQRYSRYMDDIVVGVQTRAEGFEAVARAQRALETVGLYPNASKTRIIRRADFAHDYMKEENDYLGEVGAQIKEGATVDLSEFQQRLRRHLRLNDPPRAWERVVRRYYTTARTLRDKALLSRVPEHLEAYPGSSRQILDYLSTFLMTPRRIEGVRSAINEMGSLYEDVQLLAMQYAAVAPNNLSESTRLAICDWMKVVIDGCHDLQPRLAANAVVALAKFAREEEARYLTDLMERSAPDGGLLRRQLALALLGVGARDLDWVKSLAVESNEARLMADFLAGVADGDNRAVNLALSAVTPRERRDPLMFMIPPRPLLLAPLALEALGKNAAKRRTSWGKTVARSEGPRDRVGEVWLGL